MTEFAWHTHHEVLVEPLFEPIEVRIEYIKASKPEHEIDLRLRLLKPVRGALPAAVMEAGAACDQAWAACEQAWAAYEKAKAAAYNQTLPPAATQAWAAYVQAWAACEQAWAACEQTLSDHAGEIEVLHRQECPDCPWDGHTIFSKLGGERDD